jgi:alpha-1,2-mannosyltransferase
MFLYANSLRRAAFLMVNSSWTKGHVDSVLVHDDALAETIFSALQIAIPSTLILRSMLPPPPAPREARIVYPSCNTTDMETLPLENRSRIVLSIAQFR